LLRLLPSELRCGKERPEAASLAARARFDEELRGDLANKGVERFCNKHSQRYLLAFVAQFARRLCLDGCAYGR